MITVGAVGLLPLAALPLLRSTEKNQRGKNPN
jgi:hypothetical protein